MVLIPTIYGEIKDKYMNIIYAKTYGFCYGAELATNQATEAYNKSNKDIKVLGKLIHNDIVLKDLEKEHIYCIEDIKEINNGDIVIIRAHGTTRENIEYLNSVASIVIDATCPFVKKIHNLVDDYYDNNYNIMILGDKNHPEVIGSNSHCNNNSLILNSEEQLEDNYDRLLVVEQTTFNEYKFNTIKNSIKGKDIVIKNTICNHTSKAQQACLELAKKVDIMIIVGDKNSSNTNKLYDISREYSEAYLVENELDLKNINFKNKKIGIGAGASTPKYLVNRIVGAIMKDDVLINKDNLLDANYIPEDLIITDNNENNFHHYKDASLKPMVVRRVYKHFLDMQQDALYYNYNIIIDSGYRSFNYQQVILDKNVLENGLEHTTKFVALPGSSEHQTGLAIDIAYLRNKIYTDNVKEDDKETIWLFNNSYKYGFILRYPKDKESITGYNFEPWHFRYVGISLAKYLYDNKLTLEEYYKNI